nr:BEL1-like homeodomain protein 1 [Ipomoea batatas]GME10247.1 BEL1-like homeodomain protein 1 [Ipomoea batatas]GME12855.1 BEL1-like homeodomain protein 1 [Ipomoea batatas]
MEMRNHGPEFHVVQQSRRDKLRNQNTSTPSQHMGDYRANLEHLSLHQGLNMDLVHLPGWRYGNISCDSSSSVLSSDMLNFASNPHSLVLNKDNNGDPQNCGTWKSVDLSHKIGSVWSGVANYSSGSAGIDGGNLSPMFVGENLSGSLRLNNDVPVSGIDVKTSYFGYQELQPSLTNNPSSDTSGQYKDIQTLQEVVTSAAVGTRELEMLQNARETERSSSWLPAGEEGETRLLPAYVDQSSQLFVNTNATSLVNSAVQWNGELERENEASNTQALSLSLSSVGERISSGMPDLKPLKSDHLCSYPKQGSKALGNAARQDMVGNLTFTHRDLVPLGPFTGYATILKSSRFLRPAQQLLYEFCNFTGDKALNLSEVSGNNVMDEVGISSEAVNATPRSGGGSLAVDSGASSSTFYSSNEKSSHEFRGMSSSNESYPRPEYLQNKVKLLYMQDEVCRRYRQYHQQMQMVVSSFESVAGLSAATPYISVALKAVSRQFRCFKSTISEQLRSIRKALGEDVLSPTGASSSKRDAGGASGLKFIDQTLQNQNGSGERLHYLEPQTHVWRPQRGLPERAVAILRAWLFDHFLHPYPTDTDKHMLASQTGLTRNQVSNWFINARVRVWKPMVEEIHMLETKAMVEKGSNVGKADGELGTQGRQLGLPNESQFLNARAIPDECPPGISPSIIREKSYQDMWNQDKRSRIDCGQLPVGMGFIPYQRNSLEIGGLGAVSLTLGLRQSIEGAQQQQQQQMQQHESQLRQQFGGQIIRDFAG